MKKYEKSCWFYFDQTFSDKVCDKYKGIPNTRERRASVCCSKRCGKCGGRGCNRRPGGKKRCCSRNVVKRPICGKNGRKAPCRIGKFKTERIIAQSELILHQINKKSLNLTGNQLFKSFTDVYSISVQCESNEDTTKFNFSEFNVLNDSLASLEKVNQFINSKTITQEINDKMNISHIIMLDSKKIETSTAVTDNAMLSTIKWYWVIMVIFALFLLLVKAFLYRHSTSLYEKTGIRRNIKREKF